MFQMCKLEVWIIRLYHHSFICNSIELNISLLLKNLFWDRQELLKLKSFLSIRANRCELAKVNKDQMEVRRF